MSLPPLISVVSASWNQGAFLEECIRSVGAGERNDVEHIIVDNCSDDTTQEVIKRYPHVKAIVESDSGQSNALNKGFQLARGEWILWLNVDDFLLPGALKFMLEFIGREGESFDMVYGHTVFVDAESKKIRTIFQPKWRYWMTKWGGFVAPSTGSFFRTSILKEHPLDENFHMIMDTEWMLRVGSNLRVKRVTKEIVSFRIADNKTAAHIQSGIVTPKHHQERMALLERFPFYCGEGQGVVRVVKRKLVRVVVLVGKFLCCVGALVDRKKIITKHQRY
ncbi:glycosyltransferase [Akkermansiaceae bacterium]|nr:glycosyltransferase [Akkermansiaceae bacterium]MDB4387606.1 glycosyltransferase [Akkermansiaceae bacterium]